MQYIAMYVVAPRKSATPGGATEIRYPHPQGWVVYAASGPEQGSMQDWVPDPTEGKETTPLVQAGYHGVPVVGPLEITPRQLRELYHEVRALERARRQQSTRFVPGIGRM